tara:strand:- start:61 stop:189 length:129 start_codon:yes stop_codon:yes gene_type:complete
MGAKVFHLSPKDEYRLEPISYWLIDETVYLDFNLIPKKMVLG